MAYTLFQTIVAALAVAAVAVPTLAHMEMTAPPPRQSKYLAGATVIDDKNTSPTQAICQGKPAGPHAGTYQAGSNISVSLNGTNAHGGGHCQFALSYDDGQTFVVIKDVMNTCMIDTLSYTVPLPSTALTSNHAIFAWTWINAADGREYYMNCADISISGYADGYVTGPKLLVANILGGPTIPAWGSGVDNVSPALFAARPTIAFTASGVVVAPNNNNSTTTVPNGNGSTGNSSYSPVPAPAPGSVSDSNNTATNGYGNTNTTIPGDVSDTNASNNSTINPSTSANQNCTTNSTTATVPDSSTDNSTTTVPDTVDDTANSTTTGVSDSSAVNGSGNTTTPSNVENNATTTVPDSSVNNTTVTTPIVTSPSTNNTSVCAPGQVYVCTSNTNYVYCGANGVVPMSCPSGSACQHDETGQAICQQIANRCEANAY
ncbi:hypothetical protein BDF19DRAFT_431724 [Syncephalis fuscata]|nr:hypothetical protein BDF19DRAFT_431724 [Syncephalis fuscata]